jgi:serine phosphatase RsbU (regulator of sigma subunit)
LSIQCDLPVDERIRFTARYVPNDIIGGDYYAIARLDEDRYGFLLADVMGHGVPAALYTMCLSSLWSSLQQLLIHPREFAQAVNQRLHAMVEKDEAFAAALCGLFDLKSGQLRMVGAGGPPPLVIRASGLWESPDVRGLYFGVAPEADYQETTLPLEQGDCVLFFSDGAIEIAEPRGNCLGIEGLKRILRDLGYPASDPSFEAIETKMLAASNCIRFDDDVTFIEARVMEKAARK